MTSSRTRRSRRARRAPAAPRRRSPGRPPPAASGSSRRRARGRAPPTPSTSTTYAPAARWSGRRSSSPRRGQASRRRMGWRDRRRRAVDARLAPARARFADRAEPLERAGQRELGGAEPVDEVAAPDPARLLEHPQDRVDRREAALDALVRDRLPGHDAVPVEQRECRRVESLGRRAASTSLDERPAAGGLRRTQRRQTSGPAPASRAGRFQRSARSGANVSFVTSPAQTRSQSASSTSRSEPPPAAREDLAIERGAPRRGARGSPRGGDRRGGPRHRGRRAAARLATRTDERDPAIVAAEAPPPDPRDLAHRPQLVEQPRLVARDPRRQHVPLQHGCRDRQAGELVDDLGEALERGRRPELRGGLAERGDAMPGGQEPAERGRVDGFDLATQPGERPPAEDPEHVGVEPFALRAARPELAAEDRAVLEQPLERVSTTPTGSPQRRAGSGVRNGPWRPSVAGEQAFERRRRRSQERVRDADRRRHPDPVAVARHVLDRDPALLPGDPGTDGAPRRDEVDDPLVATAAPPSDRAATSSAERSPSRRSRSWSWSAVVAFRSSVSAWRLSSRSASASGSSSSRSSSWPSSSRSRSRSSVSAPARRSASGASPSYMYAAT